MDEKKLAALWAVEDASKHLRVMRSRIEDDAYEAAKWTRKVMLEDLRRIGEHLQPLCVEEAESTPADHGTCEVVTEPEVRSGPLMGPAVVCGEPCEPETDYCAEHQPAYEPVEAYDLARDRALEAS